MSIKLLRSSPVLPLRSCTPIREELASSLCYANNRRLHKWEKVGLRGEDQAKEKVRPIGEGWVTGLPKAGPSEVWDSRKELPSLGTKRSELGGLFLKVDILSQVIERKEGIGGKETRRETWKHSSKSPPKAPKDLCTKRGERMQEHRGKSVVEGQGGLGFKPVFLPWIALWPQP